MGDDSVPDRPKFNIRRKGYDRFTVDSYIDQRNQEIEFKDAKLNVYRKQLDFLTEQLEVKQNQNIQLLNDIKSINDNLNQHSINLDNTGTIIEDAQQVADDIIMESLLIAKEILTAVDITSENTKMYKDELLSVLNKVTKSVEAIEVIDKFNFDLKI